MDKISYRLLIFSEKECKLIVLYVVQRYSDLWMNPTTPLRLFDRIRIYANPIRKWSQGISARTQLRHADMHDGWMMSTRVVHSPQLHRTGSRHVGRRPAPSMRACTVRIWLGVRAGRLATNRTATSTSYARDMVRTGWIERTANNTHNQRLLVVREASGLWIDRVDIASGARARVTMHMIFFSCNLMRW